MGYHHLRKDPYKPLLKQNVQDHSKIIVFGLPREAKRVSMLFMSRAQLSIWAGRCRLSARKIPRRPGCQVGDFVGDHIGDNIGDVMMG